MGITVKRFFEIPSSCGFTENSIKNNALVSTLATIANCGQYI
jgi:hypothetical protein